MSEGAKHHHQTTKLQNVTDWLQAVQAAHPDKIQHVTDDAIVGLQTLHTEVVRSVMQRAVERHEIAEDEGRKRKVPDILKQVHAELGLGKEWNQAVASREQAAAKQRNLKHNAKEETKALAKTTKAQRKRARKQAFEDPKLLQEQDEMLRKSQERLLKQQQQEKKNQR